MTTTVEITPAAYYALCDEARALGVPVSLDDPRSPSTVAGLLDAVVVAVQAAWLPFCGQGAFPRRREILARYEKMGLRMSAASAAAPVTAEPPPGRSLDA